MSQIFEVVLSNLSRHGIENCLEIANEIEVEYHTPKNVKKTMTFDEKVEIVFKAVLNHFPTHSVSTGFSGKARYARIETTFQAVVKTCRKRELVLFRQLMMKILCDFEAGTLAVIGQKLGRRDHTTVIHARTTIGDLVSVDKQFARTYRAIYNEVKGQLMYEN